MQIRKRLLLVGLSLLTLALILPPNVFTLDAGTPSLSASVQVKSFTVVVSRDGFNGTDKTLALNLVQGDAVHITFVYGDGDLPYDNPHVIFLVGYDLRTALITKSDPIATLDFVATETGTFAFYCLVPCVGMENLSSGAVVVMPRPPGSLPTALDVMLDGVTLQGQLVNMVATLNQGSQSVSNARVDFYVSTTFGPMRAGTAITDEEGVARMGYRFAESGNLAVIAEFAGTESLAPSSKQLNVLVEPRPEEPPIVGILPDAMGQNVPRLPYAVGQNQIPDIRAVGVPLSQSLPVITLALLIVGAVWATYAYVFAQIRAIKSGSPPQHERKEGGEAKLESTSVKKGFDKRILIGAILVAIVVAGVFAYYQFGTSQFATPPQKQTVTVKIDIKAIHEDSGHRHVFDPATVTVQKGDHVVLIVTNTDEDAPHGIVIPELDLNTGSLATNQQATLEFDADTAGTFTMYCSVPGCAPDHAQMIGQLVVVA
jgi:heme/copper-type cytochrome/quinol oxidase subunit 2